MTYESPITLIKTRTDNFIKEINDKTDEVIFKAVVNVLPEVNKEELIKALSYDREQYSKGYKDRDNEIVRCKECRWFKQDSSPVGYGYCDGRMVGREVDYNDYCSFGELADKTKYPATYNTNAKCGGCVHLDELGRCLSFMTAKDDRSCWRGSWENNNGELAEQTERREP